MNRTKPFYKEHWLTGLGVFLDQYNYNNDTINEELEKEFTKAYMRCFGLTVNSASSAIFMALYNQMDKYPERNEVIVPNWGYLAAFKAALTLGLTIVPVDLDEKTLGMDLKLLKKKMNTRTLSIIHVENNGVMGHVAEMYAMIKRVDKEVLFIEDAAPSLLQVDAGRFGDVSIFSFSPTKPLMSGEGAIMMMDDEATYDSLRQLRHTPHYNDKSASLNFRLSPFLAAFLMPQLKYAPYLAKMRDMVHWHYHRRLKIFSEYTNRHGAIMYLSDKAEKVSKALSRFGIEHRYQYYPCFSDDETNYPVSHKVKRSIIDLPMHHELEEDQIAMICNVIIRAEGI